MRIEWRGAARAVVSDEEMVQILRTFQRKTPGSLVVGLKEGQRVLPQLVPHRPDPREMDERVRMCLRQLRRVGCDSYVLIRREEHPDGPHLVVEHAALGDDSERYI